jgi:hypothetical protein
MNWDAIGAIGEVVGAVGVIVSLLYLALQIRQNSNVVRSATRQAISTTQVELGFRIAESSDLRASMAKLWGLGDPPTAAQDTEIRNLFLYRAFWRAYENQYHQFREGTFDADMWSGYREALRGMFFWGDSRQVWEQNRASFSSEFAMFVDREILASTGTEKSESDLHPK